MGLLLSRRSSTLGNSLTINTQHHGEEDVSALYLPLSQIPITAEELPALMLNDHAYKLLYRKWKGRPDEPVWGKIAPVLFLPEKVKDVNVTLFLGRRQLKVTAAVMAKRRLEPKDGGISLLSFTLQCVPDLDENHPIMENLFAKVNQKIDLELSCESYGAQPELPLEEEDPDEDDDEKDPEQDDGEELPSATHARRGRKSRES